MDHLTRLLFDARRDHLDAPDRFVAETHREVIELCRCRSRVARARDHLLEELHRGDHAADDHREPPKPRRRPS